MVPENNHTSRVQKYEVGMAWVVNVYAIKM